MRARRRIDLTFIVGGDIALGLPSWHEPEAVLGLARLAVAERSGAGREEVAALLASASRTRRRRRSSTCRAWTSPRRRYAAVSRRGSRSATSYQTPLPSTSLGESSTDDARTARRDDRRAGGRQEGDRRRRARRARRRGLHGLLPRLLGQHGAPGQGDPRRHPPGAEGRARDPAAARRGRSARRPGSSWTTSTSSCTSSRPRRATSTASSSSGARCRRARWSPRG